MYTINREYVGSITENGEAFCFGVALADDTLVYLDMAGPVETIKTICGKLVSKGRLCYLNPPRGRTIYLNPAGPKTFEVHRKKIAYGLVHCMLLHTAINQPLYGELSKTYIIHGEEQQAIQRLGYHIHQLLPIPVRSEWYPYLWQRGSIDSLVTRCDSRGGISLYAINLDQQAWTLIIQQGLRNNILHLQ